MNKKFLNAVLFGALLASSTGTFTSCKDYDDDINRLDKEISNVKDVIKSLEDKVSSGKYVESCTPFTDGNGGYEIKFTDGQTIKIYNGAKGDTGATGAPGAPGAPGSSASDYVVSVTTGETAYDLVITYADGTKKVITMPKATATVSGIKFIPTYLSEGEAPRIHFPTIVTDSIAANNVLVGGEDYTQDNYKKFSIIYSGKGELKYQVNPHSVSFDNFEVVGFVRDTAEIQNYNTNDKKWMLFDKGQVHYSDGKLTKAASYAEGHGVISFRAKDWAFAEQSNWNERNVYSFRLKNGDNIIHSDFVPAKHEVILQKNVHLAKIAETGDAAKADYHVATAPNKTHYRDFIADDYYRKQLNPRTLADYEKNKAAVEANAENALYKGTAADSKSDARIHVELPYDGGTKDLKEIVLAYFNNRAGREAANEYVLNENGFDDYSLEFTPVDFYYDGVNQTKRYLDVQKDGIVKVRLSSDWGEVPNASHTAAIDRTPIVRVKLVAPGEDNRNIVKTAIIKILIVKKETPKDEIIIKDAKEVTLMHKDQLIDMDMDKIFFHKDVQLSKDEFRRTYEFTTLPGTTEADEQTRVTLADLKTSLNQEFNQLQVTVKNTAFCADHVVYVVKGIYKAIPAIRGGANPGAPDVNIEYTVKVKYPEVVAPTKTALNWAGENHFIAHGRLNKANPATGKYEMVSVLNDMFDLNSYKPYGTKAVANDDARAVLSFELVDQHNHASKIVDGDNSGIELYQTAEGKWEIALQPTDAGRNWINEEGKTDKRIKIRAVVSFNECVDGLYGTCTNGADAHFKYAKTAQDAVACDTINLTNGTPKHTQNYASNNGIAPENGRSTVVIKEFEVAFVTPMVFYPKTIDPLYDKYEGAENLRHFNKSFFLADYLWADGAQETFKNDHIVYDNAKAGATNFDANGWANKWVTIFDADKTVHYELGDATFDDGSGKLDAENMKKIVFDQNAGTITWVNNGQDIAKEFTIHVKVCVNHRWGQVCGHTWTTADRGHSVGVLNVPVKFYKK